MSKGTVLLLVGLGIFQLITVLDEGSKVSPHDKYYHSYQVSTYKSSNNTSKTANKPSANKSTNSKSSNSTTKKSNSKKSYYDTYDSGYNDVYYDGDYSVYKYNNDENYRNGVDDALEEW